MGYKDRVLEFLNYPWHGDREIDFVNRVDKEINIWEGSNFTVKLYLQQLYKADKKALQVWTSERFINYLEDLLK